VRGHLEESKLRDTSSSGMHSPKKNKKRIDLRFRIIEDPEDLETPDDCFAQLSEMKRGSHRGPPLDTSVDLWACSLPWRQLHGAFLLEWPRAMQNIVRDEKCKLGSSTSSWPCLRRAARRSGSAGMNQHREKRVMEQLGIPFTNSGRKPRVSLGMY
jgi:hypothetical protein